MKGSTSITRRKLLKGAASVGLAIPFVRRAAASGSITFFSYSTYTDPVLTGAFSENSDTSLRTDNFGNLDQMIGRLKATDAEGIDVVSVPNQYTRQLLDEGLLEPIDTSRIERWDELYPAFRDADFIQTSEPGVVAAVPTVWGPEGLLYRTDRIESADSWNALWNPEYQGHISPVDYGYEMVLIAAQVLGYGDSIMQDPIAFTDEQYAAIKDKLIQQKPLVTKYFTSAAEGATLVASGEAWITVGRLSMLGPLNEEQIPVAMIAPKEGAQGWCTSTAISARSSNKDGAYEFLNFVIGEHYQSKLMTEKGYPVANRSLMMDQPDELRNRLMLNDPDLLSSMVWWKPAADEQRINDLWNEVKAS